MEIPGRPKAGASNHWCIADEASEEGISLASSEEVDQFGLDELLDEIIAHYDQ